ncbi:hypothetical protein [Desulfonatronum thioautotrophicum]|uniref:hypothetical protein n=1 Tax=Desulfonatronum thioautotrophicum TaxID=617001 RepID=UPI0005EB0D3F|nr:hypothetical protein [Desulfonatronum thioautotrophicum]
MKVYFVLLAILFLSTTVTRLLLLTVTIDPALSVKILADITLFALCLLACHGLAFGRRYFSVSFWAWPGRLTLILGGIHVLLVLTTLDESASPFWPIDLGMAAIIYGLFAIPAILYANELKADGTDQERP